MCKRRLFEKKSGHCDYCNRKFSKSDGKTLRRYIEDLVGCCKCRRFYLDYGLLPTEKNKELVEEYKQDHIDFVLSAHPDQLIQFVLDKTDQGMI